MKRRILDFRRVAAKHGSQWTTPRIWTGLILAGTVVVLATGCQFGHSKKMAKHPPYQQLDQVCFGYEPTVWRTMAGDCEQAHRLIPEPAIKVPPPAAAKSAVTEPDSGALDILRDVPEPQPTEPEPTEPEPTPGTGRVPRIALPPDVPESVPPVLQDVPIPADPPGAAEPADPPAVREVPLPNDPQPPMTRFNTYPAPVPARPAVGRSSRNPVADGLFQTVQQALHADVDERTTLAPVTTPESGAERKRPAAGLSRFISH